MQTVFYSILFLWLSFGLWSYLRYDRRIHNIQMEMESLAKSHERAVGIEKRSLTYNAMMTFYNQNEGSIVIAQFRKTNRIRYELSTLFVCVLFGVPSTVVAAISALKILFRRT